ncbi:RNA polymerase sigma factor [Flavitalea flava]
MQSEPLYNETDLLIQVARGDRLAFQTLYTEYYPLVRQYLALFQSSEIVRNELAQDVFIRIWDKRIKLSGVTAFKGYLFRMTKNIVLNYIRALKVQQKLLELKPADEPFSENEPENELLFKQYYRIALIAIDKLPERRQKILKMSIEQGLTLDEIAQEFNITRAGVKKQLYAATSFVRQYLLDNGEMSLLLVVFLTLFEI